jgi:hypothetical protein
MKGFSVVGLIGIVVAGIAVSDATNFRGAPDAKSYKIRAIGDDSTLSV